MTECSRRNLLKGVAAAMAVPVLRSAPAEAALPELTLWGPPAGPSITLVHAIASGLLRSIAEKVTFKAWRSPDELRAGLTSKTMDVFILPTQTAANLFNRGLGVRLLNVMTNGLLHVVSSDETLTSIPALKGRIVAVPYRNDTPDVIFRRLLVGHGLDPEKDVTLRFVGSPVEAVQLLLTGRADAALLPEPAATAAIMASGIVTKTLFRTIDVQQAWGKATGLGSALPQAGVGVTERFLASHGPTVEVLHNALVEAAASVNANPERAAADAFEAMWTPAPVIVRSIPHSNLVAVRAAQARPTLEAVLRSIAEFDAKIIGGKLPPADFYL